MEAIHLSETHFNHENGRSTFLRNVDSYTLEMEAVFSSEKLIPTYRTTTQCSISEKQNEKAELSSPSTHRRLEPITSLIRSSQSAIYGLTEMMSMYVCM